VHDRHVKGSPVRKDPVLLPGEDLSEFGRVLEQIDQGPREVTTPGRLAGRPSSVPQPARQAPAVAVVRLFQAPVMADQR
jgi:hypothetical protein